MDGSTLLLAIVVVTLGYACGSVPVGVLVARAMGGPDPRTIGSGRTGSTNALRALGPRGAGLVVLGVVGSAVFFVWRRQPPLAELLRWLAFVLLVANLVNKQAFYNQFWLVGALVAASMATRASTSSSRNGG